MRHRWFILVAVVLLVLVGGAVAAYAYDSSVSYTHLTLPTILRV